jgi:hypothetical protein
MIYVIRNCETNPIKYVTEGLLPDKLYFTADSQQAVKFNTLIQCRTFLNVLSKRFNETLYIEILSGETNSIH